MKKKDVITRLGHGDAPVFMPILVRPFSVMNIGVMPGHRSGSGAFGSSDFFLLFLPLPSTKHGRNVSVWEGGRNGWTEIHFITETEVSKEF